MEELDKRISEIVRSTVKEFMESLLKGEITAFLEDHNGSRNGYYERDLGTRYGKIDNLRVPRDRDNEFQTALFDRYQRNIGIDDLVVSCTVSHSSGQFTKRIMIRFLPFHLPFVLSYFFPSLIFLPSQSWIPLC